MKSTASSSINVKPLVPDILVRALAALAPVGAERDKVIGLAVARHRIAIVVAPRILQVRILGIGSVPFFQAGRLPHQRLQVLRILADLEAIELDVAGEALDPERR